MCAHHPPIRSCGSEKSAGQTERAAVTNSRGCNRVVFGKQHAPSPVGVLTHQRHAAGELYPEDLAVAKTVFGAIQCIQSVTKIILKNRCHGDSSLADEAKQNGRISVLATSTSSHPPHAAWHRPPWPRLALRGLPWPRMALHGLAWPRLPSHGLAWPHMASHDLAWLRLASHGLALLRMPSHRLAPLRLASHCIAWPRLARHRMPSPNLAWPRPPSHVLVPPPHGVGHSPSSSALWSPSVAVAAAGHRRHCGP